MKTIGIRTELRAGDIGRIVELHGSLYAREYGYGLRFEAYVAEGLGQLAGEGEPARTGFWLAEREARLVGCIAVGSPADGVGQIRYFLVDPAARGTGLGRRLLEDALAFCADRGLRSIFLWTTSDLAAAAHLYRSAGFRLVEEVAEPGWGPPVTKQRYDLDL